MLLPYALNQIQQWVHVWGDGVGRELSTQCYSITERTLNDKKKTTFFLLPKTVSQDSGLKMTEAEFQLV